MTDEELRAIEERAIAAYTYVWVDSNGVDVWEDHPANEPDGNFIGYARTDIPALIAEIRRLRSNLLKWREQTEHWWLPDVIDRVLTDPADVFTSNY